jgi:phosphoadenosine phosphosulfate reductase
MAISTHSKLLTKVTIQEPKSRVGHFSFSFRKTKKICVPCVGGVGWFLVVYQSHRIKRFALYLPLFTQSQKGSPSFFHHMHTIASITHELSGLPADQGLAWVSRQFKNVAFSSALGEEDQIITHLISTQNLPIEIFTLDTGRLFAESYDLLDLTRKKYQLPITTYFPDSTTVEAWVNTKGINAFYDSVENRKECCGIRKVQPLKRALAHADVWVTGLRGQQSANRQQMARVEWDHQMNLIKYNPLLNWTDEEMRHFISHHQIPVNPLHKKGYVSIGCAPCTRALLTGEDSRAGRWWWETSAKECGLHETHVKK